MANNRVVVQALSIGFRFVMSAGWVPFQDTMQKENKTELLWSYQCNFMGKIDPKIDASFLLLFWFYFEDSIGFPPIETQIMALLCIFHSHFLTTLL
jgi:hypothetical protein